MVKYIQVEVCGPLVQDSMYLLLWISHQARNVCLLEVHSDFSTALFCWNIIKLLYIFFCEFLALCQANIELFPFSKSFKEKEILNICNYRI